MIPTFKGKYRVQYQVKRWWKTGVGRILKLKNKLMTNLEDGVRTAGLLDSSLNSGTSGEVEIRNASDASSQQHSTKIESNLNKTGRIDFVLQEREIENSNNYIFALGAHTVYWDNKDLSQFIAQQLSL